jgi:two-component system sensor histidine kinase UhpB
MDHHLSAVPLYWRVFATNATVLLLAFLGLVLLPVTVSVPVTSRELAILGGGLFAMLLLNLVLLRPAVRPLDVLADYMRAHDPLSPGSRVPVTGDPDVVALAEAFNDMLDRLESERRESARQALRVLEGERSRIARELHDEVGQTLTGVMLQVESLAARVPDDLQPQVEELRETARKGTVDVRHIARRLRPVALEDLGLQRALAALANAFSEQAHVRVDRRLDPPPALSAEQELVVYRVAQEALTNVARHAGATQVELRFERDEAHAVLTVRDDGRGIPPEARSSSQGIRGMRERAMLIGAELRIRRPRAGGTAITLTIPLDPEEAA